MQIVDEDVDSDDGEAEVKGDFWILNYVIEGDTFMEVNSDQEARESLRQQIMIDYIKANGLAVTKYQDEGWDPVELAM